ncbi:hypothetical protein AOLI_G00141620 [Acnodon oligacanthus]
MPKSDEPKAAHMLLCKFIIGVLTGCPRAAPPLQELIGTQGLWLEPDSSSALSSWSPAEDRSRQGRYPRDSR